MSKNHPLSDFDETKNQRTRYRFWIFLDLDPGSPNTDAKTLPRADGIPAEIRPSVFNLVKIWSKIHFWVFTHFWVWASERVDQVEPVHGRVELVLQLGTMNNIKNTVLPLSFTDYFFWAYLVLTREIRCLMIKWLPCTPVRFFLFKPLENGGRRVNFQCKLFSIASL